MPYKRYGGNLEKNNLWGNDRFAGVAVTIAFVGGLVSYGVGSFLLLLAANAITVSIMLVGFKYLKVSKNKYKEQRINHHFKLAKAHYDKGNNDLAMAAISKVKIHGDLPKEFKNIETLISGNKKIDQNAE